MYGTTLRHLFRNTMVANTSWLFYLECQCLRLLQTCFKYVHNWDLCWIYWLWELGFSWVSLMGQERLTLLGYLVAIPDLCENLLPELLFFCINFVWPLFLYSCLVCIWIVLILEYSFGIGDSVVVLKSFFLYVRQHAAPISKWQTVCQ